MDEKVKIVGRTWINRRSIFFILIFALLGGVLFLLFSSAEDSQTSTDPNTVILQYSLPHVMMPINANKLGTPVYAPFTLYGNGLLICGQNGPDQFSTTAGMEHMDMNGVNTMPTSKTLSQSEVGDLVQRVVGTGFLKLAPEYFNRPDGAAQHTIRLNLTGDDHFVMYYGDVTAPQAYIDTLQILADACSTVTEPYQPPTVKLRTLQNPDATGKEIKNLGSAYQLAIPAITRGQQKAQISRKNGQTGLQLEVSTDVTTPGETVETLSGDEAKVVYKEFGNQNRHFYKSSDGTYEVGADPVPPKVANPLQVNYAKLRSRKVSRGLLQKLHLIETAHASSGITPVRVVVLLAADGGDSKISSQVQTIGNNIKGWYCGQVGKCYDYQGVSVIRGSQTMAYYTTCHRTAGCIAPLDALVDNVWSKDYGTVMRPDVDTLIVTGWFTNSLVSNACGIGYIGENLGAIDGFAPTITNPGAGGYYCQENENGAHELGHTFGLGHTGNGTLMDGSPYSQYAANCDIGSPTQPLCKLDSTQVQSLQSSAGANIFNVIDSAASTGPATPLYRYWSPNKVDHFYNTSRVDNSVASIGWTSYEGCEANIYTGQQANMVPIYRYWNGSVVDNFYTIDRNDTGYGAYGYSYIGVTGYVYPPASHPTGSIPLYRYWNATGTDHFYTTVRNDAGYSYYGYGFERVEGYLLPPPANHCNYSTTPLWRYWSSRVTDHFYTTLRNDSGYEAYSYGLEKCEARVWTEQGPGMVPFWRYWNSVGTDHFYTVDRNDPGYSYYGYSFEGQEGWVYPYSNSSVGTPLYRYWSPSRIDHFYTVDRNDSYYGLQGYAFEKIEAYVKKVDANCN
jgi:hypothetical protein